MSPTPNPAAMKLTVGVPVGGPLTARPGDSGLEGYLEDLVGIEGVASVFLTANFITITKTPPADWEAILTDAVPILEERFGG